MERYNATEFWNRSHEESFSESPLIKTIEKLPFDASKDGPWIAGGAIRRTIMSAPLESDIDVFVASEDQFKSITEMLAASGKKSASTSFHETYIVTPDDGKPIIVQVMRQCYASLDAVLETFDFTLCQVGFDGVDFVFAPYALLDIARKRLVPAKITYGVASVRRIIKYTKQGFFICGGGIAEILNQILANPETVSAAIEYID